MKKNIITKAALLVAVVGLLAQSSHATVSYQSSLTSAGGAAVNATANITISGSTMTVKLTDLLANPADAANLLSGIKISISGVSGVSGFGANSATVGDIAADGSYTPTAVTGATLTGPNAWVLSFGNPTIKLTALNAQPDYTIIGPDANNNFTSGAGDAGYTGANSSIAGNNPHNPAILGSATFFFTLAGPGAFLEGNISDVTFLFGTGTDSSGSTKITTSVPEPATVVAGALLLLPLGVSAIRILRKNRAV